MQRSPSGKADVLLASSKIPFILHKKTSIIVILMYVPCSVYLWLHVQFFVDVVSVHSLQKKLQRPTDFTVLLNDDHIIF